MRKFKLGVDVGGTFTDLVAIDDAGNTVIAKSPSTPEDQSLGVIQGLNILAERLGTDLAGLLSNTERFVHGTTVATNALLEKKGAKVALITTQGHRDVLEMREGFKEDRYNLRLAPFEPLVPRDLRYGLAERTDFEGRVIQPVDLNGLAEIVSDLKRRDIGSVAICLLHSYRNAKHEEEVESYLRSELPDVFVSRSSDVLPQIKEYERTSTTVVNAYVGPAVKRYLTNLECRLQEAGFLGRLFIILSHGGMAPVEEAWRLASATVLSGPAGGIAGSRMCAQLLSMPDLIPFDMGGTSTDISLILGGHAILSADGDLAGQRIALKSLDIASIASGGGSIAKITPSGQFDVGPASAGSVPGPVCYDNGGREITVTDANLILGYLDPDNFLGGKKKLNYPEALKRMQALAETLGVGVHDAAAGIYRLVNMKMADGIRIMTLRRGVDPRRFALLSFGGAAGLHAVAVARELEIPKVVIPTMASVLSAWGMLNSDLRYEVSRTLVGEVRAHAAEIATLFADLDREARAKLSQWYTSEIRTVYSAEMRYGEQIFEIDVSLDGADISSPEFADDVIERFHRQHEQLYTYALRDQEVTFVNARVAAVGPVDSGARQDAVSVPQREAPPPNCSRPAYFGVWTDTPVYEMADLPVGATLAGPAILVAETTSVIVQKDDIATVNSLGWVEISLADLRQY
ncbi:hydantoinase/oxoprolinase family protein (plasmid) [Mesorhizobium sp. AR10]|uniref:hydantoinase/oxoprolinase family protein n=1 Tax=Mesorhizobium sp. AR10 TaxID=2865839 RepID=UPI00215FDDF7|nr:hydantoinase/oxoprolinase family protein [Mesorhizobium sp. AR10]UVK35927.1 hydantoinase/oxoprolinase family protein [Mesorhizobium sp. AR10]